MTNQPPSPQNRQRSGYQGFCLFAAWIIGPVCIFSFVGLGVAAFPLLDEHFARYYQPMTDARRAETWAVVGTCAREVAELLTWWVIVLGLGRIASQSSSSAPSRSVSLT